MTKKLYLEYAYLQSCKSNVIGRKEVDGKPGVILDQTVFYPTSGGQPHDTGTINDVAVIDVLENLSRLRPTVGEIAPHAHCLRALAREKGGNFRHLLFPSNAGGREHLQNLVADAFDDTAGRV